MIETKAYASMRRLAGVVALGLAIAAVPRLATAQESPTLSRIKSTGTITLGYRDAATPLSFLGKDGKPSGYSIDLCAKIVDRVKAELSLPQLQVKYVSVNPQTRIPMLAAGSIDLECGATTDTFSREEQVDMSFITFVGGTRLLVTKASGIKDIADLDGKIVALPLGSTNEPAVRKIIADKKLNVKVISVKDHPEGFAAVQTNRADAYASDDIALYGQIQTAKEPGKFTVVGGNLTYEPLAFMMRRNDSAFRRLVNMTIADVYRSGEINPLYEKWFGPLGMPQNPLFQSAVQLQSIPK